MRIRYTAFRCNLIYILLLVFCAEVQADNEISAITIPSADITLSFIQAGRIDKVLIKEGDKIDANDLVMEQFDAAEEALLAQKKLDLKRFERAREHGAATELEVEHAQLEVRIAEIRYDIMKLKSPIKGSVEKIDVEVGESVKALDSAVRIVRTDPLWIDVPVPLDRTYALKVGDMAGVKFPGSETASVPGKIIVVTTAADAASSTLRIRIEVPNKTGRPSGEHVLVNLDNRVENQTDKGKK